MDGGPDVTGLMDASMIVGAPAPPLPSPVTPVDRHLDAEDLIRRAFATAQLEGGEPFVHRFTVDHPVAVVSLLPPGTEVERSVTTSAGVLALVRTAAGHALISTTSRSSAVTVSAATDREAASVVEDMRARAGAPDGRGTVPIRIWHLGCGGRPQAHERRIEAQSWAAIEVNYPSRVRAELAAIVDLEPPPEGGRLILWHGAPGTGKTTAIRALLRAWEPWCAGQYVADPERLFADPAYLTEVATRAVAPRFGPTLWRAGQPAAMWSLLIAEDCDEFLRASARMDAGAALGRLLNLADGILGQGFNILVLLTTNEERFGLHPAVIRPGRCLAEIEFTPFPVHEARRWLQGGATVGGPCTLAELFRRRSDRADHVRRRDGHRGEVGQYL